MTEEKEEETIFSSSFKAMEELWESEAMAGPFAKEFEVAAGPFTKGVVPPTCKEDRECPLVGSW